MNRSRRSSRAWRALTALALAVVAAGVPAAEPAANVVVEQVQVVVSPVGPVVLLTVRKRAVPIFVDAIVAESIQGALSGQKTARPLTHDLMHAVIEGFGGRVTQVVVTLQDNIFHAALSVTIGTVSRVFDSRSSDAIALAIHFSAPILVSEDLVDAVGIELARPGEVRS